ncbi:MAG: POTRA domain-containing protein [Pseudomonadota bacterium]
MQRLHGFHFMLCWALIGGYAHGADTAAPDHVGPRFDVLEYRVEGNTVLGATVIEQAVTPLLGPAKALAEVEQARMALEGAYRDAGYASVLVDIPEQKVDSGVVVLRVVEGKVGRVRVTGANYFSQEQILRRVPSLALGGVPWFPAVQQDLGALGRVADRRVLPVMRPGKAAGTLEVDLNVEDHLPLHASLEMNNRYSANTSRARMNGMLRYDNLWQREHSYALQFQTSPSDMHEVRVVSTSYVLPVGQGGTQLAVYAVTSRSNVAALSDITVLGRGDIVGLRGIFPLAAGAVWSHSLTLGVDYKNFQENVTLTGAPTIETPIEYVPFMAQYAAFGRHYGGITQFNAGANIALRDVGSRQADFDNKRFKAQNNYLVLRWDMQRTQDLPVGSALMLRVDGQFADQPLVSNEQYAAGGADSVRGYLESEQIGDLALHGTLELRGPAVHRLFPNTPVDVRAHLFWEAAQVRLLDPLPQQQDRFSLSSAGAGIRVKAWKQWNLSLDAGWPFKDTRNTHSGKLHAHAATSYEF